MTNFSSIVKKTPGMKAAKRHAVGAPAPGEYGLQIDEDGGVTVMGVNSAKELVDISGVATLAATSSSDPSILSVDPPVGMSCAYHAQGVGKAVVNLVATWSDGSVGPFTFADPCDVDKNAIRGAQVTHTTPTPKP